MGRGSSTLLLFASAAALALAVALLLRPTAPEVPDRVAVDGAPSAVAPDHHGGAAAGPQEPSAVGAPRVLLEAEVVARLHAPSVPGFAVRHEGREVEAEVEVLGGALAGWPLTSPAAGSSLVRVRLGARSLLRRIESAAAVQTIAIELGSEVLIEGRIHDELGRPIAQAQVWVGEPGVEVVTDAEGGFAVAALGGDGVPVVARAMGHASAHRFVDLRGGTARIELMLGPGCDLGVQFAGPLEALPGARLHVLPGELHTTGILQFPWFAAEIAAVAGGGGFEVRGLPREARVQLIAQGPLLPATPPLAVELRAAAAQATVQIAVRGTVCRGVVVDELGAPIEGAVVHAVDDDGRRGQLAARWLLPGELALRAATRAVTSADGSFAIGVAAKDRILVMAGDRAIAELDAWPPHVLQKVPLPAWREGDAVLLVPPPQAGVAWQLRARPWQQAFTAVAADQHGRVSLPGPCVLDLAVRVERGGRVAAPQRVVPFAVVGEAALPERTTAQ